MGAWETFRGGSTLEGWPSFSLEEGREGDCSRGNNKQRHMAVKMHSMLWDQRVFILSGLDGAEGERCWRDWTPLMRALAALSCEGKSIYFVREEEWEVVETGILWELLVGVWLERAVSSQYLIMNHFHIQVRFLRVWPDTLLWRLESKACMWGLYRSRFSSWNIWLCILTSVHLQARALVGDCLPVPQL